MIAKESEEPIGSEFRTTFEEQNFGLPLRNSFEPHRTRALNRRFFFVTSLMIQKETGGNLRGDSRRSVTGNSQSIPYSSQGTNRTAQGKLTAAILIAIPPIMLVGLSVLNPQYMKVLTEDPAGPTILGIAATLQIVGSAILWKIIHIEV